jgi:hypothetical protein
LDVTGWIENGLGIIILGSLDMYLCGKFSVGLQKAEKIK